MNKSCFAQFPVIETDRLLLREIIPSDVDAIYAIFSDPEVAKYDWFQPLDSHAKAARFIARYQHEYTNEEEITWGIEVKATGQLVGICCLGDFEEDARRAEIGYDIARVEWNKGYATEAIKAVVEYGLTVMDLNRIEAWITPGNDASVRVLQHANFTQEGIVRERDYMKGKLEDGIIMAILKRDYMAAQAAHA